MRVLVVEDEVRMANVIRRSLTKEGVATDVANDGDRALLMATAVDYDAIVLDVMLPDGSGFDACRVLRGRVVAGADVDCARRGRGSGRGTRQRRR
jgi:DNA-binding response OmpR family regulator